MRTAPHAVRAAAREAIDLLARGHRWGTPVGWARAHQLASGAPVSDRDIVAMCAYFARHAVDRRPGWRERATPGYGAWQGWGGDAGRAWACRERARLGRGAVRRNPVNVPLLEYRLRPSPRRDAFPLDLDGELRYRARTLAFLGDRNAEVRRLDHEYFALLAEVLRKMEERTYQARAAYLFDPPVQAAQTGHLARYMALQLRDTYAGTLIVNTIHADLYDPNVRLRTARGKFDFAGYRASLEATVALFDAYFEARARFEMRPDRFQGIRLTAGFVARYTGAPLPTGGPPVNGVQLEERGLEQALAEGQQAVAAEAVEDARVRLSRVGKFLSGMAYDLGWKDIAPLLVDPNLTKLRGAVTRMRLLAQRGEPEERPTLEILEEFAQQDDLSPEGEKLLKHARRVHEKRVARGVQAAQREDHRLRDLYGATREAVRLHGGGLELTWEHADPLNPAFTQYEVARLTVPNLRLYTTGPFNYRVETVGSDSRRGRPRTLRRAWGSATYNARAPGVPPLEEIDVRGEDHGVAERMAVMFRRALQVWHAAQAREAPPAAAFRNPTRRSLRR